MSMHTRNARESSQLERGDNHARRMNRRHLTDTGRGIDAEHGEISRMCRKTEQSGLHVLRVTSQIDEGDD